MHANRILIVDDEERSRHLLARVLEKGGFEVTECGGGQEALHLIESGEPLLLVLDYEMPDLTGVQVCELIRQNADPRIASLPIIMLTGHAGEEHEIECLKAGADDFVTKPINLAILTARIETHLRLHTLRAQLERRNAEHERDLEAARITQQAILPTKLPHLPGWQVSAHYQPVIQVGGDIYDWRRQSDGSWLFWVADATGHGASAALLTTLTKLVFRHASSEAHTPGAILHAVNAEFYSIFKGGSFITAACMVLAPETGHLSFAGAGHPPLIIQRPRGTTTFGSQNPPIGITRELRDAQDDTQLEPGDLALLYTDGLFSPRRPDGTHRDPEDLLPLLPPSTEPAERFLQTIIRRVAGESPLPDDLAAIALRRE